MSLHPYLKTPGVAISAHRGGSMEAPENTLESFKYSLELGCAYIETDVQLSADGIPFIFHDDDLNRLLGKDLIFNNLHSEEINQLRLFEAYQIPTLKEVLKKFPDANLIDVIPKDNKKKEFARGLSSFSSEEVKKIMGYHSNEIQKILGYVSKSEVVHKDNMVKI